MPRGDIKLRRCPDCKGKGSVRKGRLSPLQECKTCRGLGYLGRS